MWRNVKLDDLKGLQHIYIGGAMLTGAVFIATAPPLTNQAISTTRLWGVGLMACSALAWFGEIWINRGHSDKRWLPAWTGQVGLTSLYVGLAFDFLINVGTKGSAGLELLLAILCLMVAAVHRLFIHWRSDVE